MTRRAQALRFFDFSGGLNTKAPVTALQLNEAQDLQNINLFPSGGFEQRRGNSEFNSTAMVSGSTAIQGLGYYRQADQDDFLVVVAATAVFKSDDLDGTMDTITAGTITSGQDNIWVSTNFNDLILFAGGPDATADAPFKWDGSGNIAAIGGTPPSGRFILNANNRAFIGDINSNRSRIQWSVLNNPEDWTNSGSGNQDVGLNDGDTLVGAQVLNIDHMLMFKQNSIHDLIIRNDPFPLFPLFTNVGAVSKRGIVSVDGLIYFITPEPRMKATDGTKIIDFPDTIDDVWDSLSTTRLKFLHGQYNKRLHQIIWIVSSSAASTHDLAIIWDIKRQAWLRHTTGYKMNVSVIAQDRRLFGGAYDGKLYEQDKSSIDTDASETTPGNISAFWRTGWMDLNSTINSKYFKYFDTSFVGQTSGTFEMAVGYDFGTDRTVTTIDMTKPGGKWGAGRWGTMKWGGRTDRTKIVFAKGQGKYVQFLARHRDNNQPFAFNGFELPIKEGASKALI